MTTVTPPRPATTQARPAPAAVAGPALPPIDPFKLFQRHWKKMIVAGIAGGVLGIGAHVAWMYVYPIYTAEAIFQCEAPPAEGDIVAGGKIDTDEMDRFMATQAAIMVSQRVLEKATQDPSLQAVAKTWCSGYIRNGRFSYSEAATDLSEDLAARVIPETYLISLSLGWKDKEEVAGLVGVVRKAYAADLQSSGNAISTDLRGVYNRTISQFDKDIADLQSKRDKLLEGLSADSLDVKEATERAQLNSIIEQGLMCDTNLGAAQVQLQQLTADIRGNGTHNFSDELRAMTEMDPAIQRIKASLDALNAQLLAMQVQGIGPEHRSTKQVRAQIQGQEQTLETTREQLLRERYDANLDQLQKGISQLLAQRADLSNQAIQVRDRLNALTILSATVAEMSAQIARAGEDKAAYESNIKREEAIRKTLNADRVRAVQLEQVPQEVAFPKIYYMVPAGIVVVCGLFGGLIVLRELLDQRIKGPADIAMIPRTRVLGMIPHASEDPSGPESVESVFLDHPRGVVAESFRQVRATITERMAHARHKSLLVVSGMPSSGGSTVVANLAAAAAAGDQRILIIDANFRRPAQHRIFKIGETPGLAEVLGGTHTLDQATQPSSVENLSILTCGSPTARHFERLATEKMTAVIREASDKYDLVIIDVAPAMVSGDANAMASRCDASMIVVRAFNEKRGMVNRLKNELQEGRAELLGVLVNGVRSAAGGYLRRNIKATHEYQNNGKA
jgi:polysaccharide biosynthesis transport protein